MADPKPTRPICPKCQREMVFVALAYPGLVYHTFMCDCFYRDDSNRDIYPAGLVADIVRAREFNDGSLVIDLGKVIAHIDRP